MDNELDIVIEGDVAYVFTPYSDAFVKKIKDRISGRMYVPQARCWCIPVEAIESVRKIMMEVFGKTDETKSNRGDVEVRITHEIVSKDKPLYLMGKIIAVPETESYDGVLVDSNIEFKKGFVDVSKENHTLILKKGTVLIFKRMKSTSIVKSNFYECKVL